MTTKSNIIFDIILQHTQPWRHTQYNELVS
jgi:hypothetical protein